MSIEVRGLSKTFPGSFPALRDVSLTVPAGELVALLGPSGSGKTTLLRVIAGLEQPDPGSGPILFHEEDVAGTHVRHRGVGFVFQHYALFRHLSVFENVAFGLRVRPRRERPGADAIRERVMRLLALVQLGSMADRYPHQLSGGQRQRVALARALAVEPRVLLLDEPFGALDAQVRKELRLWLRRLHDEIRVTSVFVTHDQEEALEVADRVAVMNAGRIEQCGTPDEVFHRPASEFVMRFLGQVNLFHCRAEEDVFSFDAPRPNSGVPALVRPHEIDIVRESGGRSAVPATVVRVHSAGALVKVDLRDDHGHFLHAELPHARQRALALVEGLRVFVNPRAFRVFAGGVQAESVAQGGSEMVRRGESPAVGKGTQNSVMLALSTFRRSEKAVDLALDSLRPGGRLLVLHVVDINLARYFVGSDVGMYAELRDRCEAELLAEHEKEGRASAEAIAGQARARGLEVGVIVRVGRFGLIAEEVAKEVAPDLIITTRSNRPEWVKRLFGSPVSYLIEKAPCPVVDA